MRSKMDVILVRHAQAEPDPDNDAERPLTKEGIKKFKRVATGLSTFINTKSQIALLSSPLKRAKETADLLAMELEVDKVEILDGLAGGSNLAAFLPDYLQVSSAECLILVGHQPDLSEWSLELSGLTLPFKKGAAACFRIHDSASLVGELRWFVQPGVWPKH